MPKTIYFLFKCSFVIGYMEHHELKNTKKLLMQNPHLPRVLT